MEQSTLPVQLRSEMGKGPARRLRVKGLIPAVLYRGSQKPVHLSVDPRTLERALRTGVHTLLKLDVAGGADPNGEVVLLKEVQRDPIYDRYMHADFVHIDLTKPMQIGVAVVVKGTAPGAVLGGVLQVVMRNIMVKCLPTEIPHHIEADVSAMNIGDSLKISDLKFPAGVECLEEQQAPVVVVTAPQLEEKPKVEEAAEGEAAAAEGAEGAAPAAGAAAEKKPAAAAEKKEEKKEEKKKGEGKK